MKIICLWFLTLSQCRSPGNSPGWICQSDSSCYCGLSLRSRMPEGERDEDAVKWRQIHTGRNKWDKTTYNMSYTQASAICLRSRSESTLGVDNLFVGQAHRDFGLIPNIVLKHCQPGRHAASFSSYIVSNSVSPRQINNMVLGSI